jgi:glycosyltransferase involved in cell wall biosynthesis
MINIVVFSKNRACQLELLLRSMKLFFDEWALVKTSILYTYTSEKFKKGYEQTMKTHPEFSYVLEQPGNFRNHVISLIDPNNQGTMFFVDDQVFKNNFCLKSEPVRRLLSNPNLACLSLRMDPGMDYCYPEKRSTPPPQLTENLEWFWPGLPGDWGYPHSVDSHLYRTDDILPLIKELDYSNPNTFEGALAGRPPYNRPYMVCYEESKVMNIPVNKVQTANGNHCGNIPAEYLNDQYLESKRISLSNIAYFKNTAPHQEITYILENLVPEEPVVAEVTAPLVCESKELVSVCIPAYEMSGYGVPMLTRAVESVLCQKYKNYEIVVSDHSTSEYIENYVKTIPGIKYTRCLEGHGISSVNLNNAIRHASGSLIKPLFQDDFFYDENSLGNFVAGLGTAAWGAGVSIHYAADGVHKLHPHVPRQTSVEQLLRGINGVGCPSAVIFRNTGNFFDSSLIWLMDTEFYQRQILKYGQMKILDQALVGIRVWDKSVGNTLATDLVKKQEQEYVMAKDKKIVTFVVPSLGRDSLERTVRSLQDQTLDSWQCIIIFDGIKCPPSATWRGDSRITYLEIAKAGTSANRHGNGGLVRNAGLPHVLTKYTAFLDDDDYLDPTYVESIDKDIGSDMGIVFRMRMPSGKIVPPIEMGNQIAKGHVGISYVVRTDRVRGNNIRFINSNSEDFEFLDAVLKTGATINVSNKALYIVGANE